MLMSTPIRGSSYGCQGFIQDFWIGGRGSIGASTKHINVRGYLSSLTICTDFSIIIFANLWGKSQFPPPLYEPPGNGGVFYMYLENSWCAFTRIIIRHTCTHTPVTVPCTVVPFFSSIVTVS